MFLNNNQSKFLEQARTGIDWSTGLADILGQCLSFFGRTLPATQLRMNLLDHHTQTVRTIAWANQSEREYVDAVASLPQEAWDQVLAQGPEAWLLDQFQQEPLGRILCERSWSEDLSALILPLFLQGKMSALVSATAAGAGLFSEQHRLMLTSLGPLFNQCLLRNLQKDPPHPVHSYGSPEVDRNKFFREAANRICGNLDFDQAIWSCLQYLSRFIPAESMMVHLWESGGEATRVFGRNLNTMGRRVEVLIPLRAEDRRAVLESNLPQVRIINRPQEEPTARPFIEHFGGNWSSLVMMLTNQGKVIGTLVLSAYGPDRYTEQHLELFSLLHDPFHIALSNTLRHAETLKLKEMLEEENRYLHEELQRPSVEGIVGADSGLGGVMEMVRMVASLDSPVLLLGETGVGKDVIANAIHYSSSRSDGPFVKVNSGAIPDTLLDSELFGHEKGSFTGAVSRKRGRFERAHGGTIFLDEIGDLPPQAQVRMLRVLQSREVERVGGAEPIPVDIRIIAATHRNLHEMVRDEKFREDLWFRINVFPIIIPPLRARKEDIPALVLNFVEQKSRALRLHPAPAIAPGAMDRLLAHDWPGNIRELENLVERELILSRGAPLTFLDAARGQAAPPAPAIEPDLDVVVLDEVVSRHIRRVLALAKGKINGPGGAAELLNINPNTLRNRMNKLGISYGRKSR